MVIHGQQGSTTKKNKVLETRTNFFKNNAKLMFLFFSGEDFVFNLPVNLNEIDKIQDLLTNFVQFKIIINN